MDCDRLHKYAELYEMIAKKPKPDLEDIEGFLERENITSEECHRLQAKSPLCAAALINSPDVFKYFISLGFDPNALGSLKRPIHVECSTVWHEDDKYDDNDEVKKRRQQSRADNFEVVRILVKDNKVDVNVSDESDNGAPPLHYAAENSRLEVVKLLVEAGANVDAWDKKGYTPLHLATESDNPELCEYLLSSGAFIDATRDEYRPLHHAASFGHVNVVKVLLDAGASVNEKYGEDSPLFCACLSGNLDVVQLLISRGAKEQTDERQGDMLRFAISCGDNDIVRCFLVEKGVSPNLTDRFEQTMFSAAMSAGNTEAGNLLVACGCSPDRDELEKPVPGGLDSEEYKILVDHVWKMSENPRKLQEICCIKIRSLLGENIVKSVNALQIPTALKDSLLLKHV